MHPALHFPVSADLQPQSHHFPRQIKPLGNALCRASAGPETGLQGGGMEVLTITLSRAVARHACM